MKALVNQYASKEEQKTLQKKLDQLNEMHLNLTQQMHSQTAENKKLRASMKRNQDQVHDQQYMQTFAIENLEKMLAEARSDNRILTMKLEDLQKSLTSPPSKSDLKWMATSEKLMD